MKAAICDDIQRDLQKIADAAAVYRENHPEISLETEEYMGAMSLIDAIERGKAYDIVLLDICMPGILGTEAAKELLRKNPDTNIIFLTTSEEYAVEAFALNATHYLLKPFTQEQFNAAMDRALQKASGRELISITCVDGVYRLGVREIVYFESQRHYLLLHLAAGETLKLRSNVSQMLEKMEKYEAFIRVGASYIVNLDFVRKISGKYIEMSTGDKILIPRRRAGEVQEAYMDFCRKEALK